MASLNALIIAKTKRFETERFLYLWMAMNALYRYYTVAFCGCGGKNDSVMLKHFAALYGFGPVANNMIFEEKQRYNKIDTIILRRKTELFLEDILSTSSNSSCELLSYLEQKGETFSPYGYFLLTHSYYHRCELFHANRAVKLLSFPEESNILILRALNTLIENFLDTNLHLWFDIDYRENIIKVVSSCLGSTHIDPFTGQLIHKSN